MDNTVITCENHPDVWHQKKKREGSWIFMCASRTLCQKGLSLVKTRECLIWCTNDSFAPLALKDCKCKTILNRFCQKRREKESNSHVKVIFLTWLPLQNSCFMCIIPALLIKIMCLKQPRCELKLVLLASVRSKRLPAFGAHFLTRFNNSWV